MEADSRRCQALLPHGKDNRLENAQRIPVGGVAALLRLRLHIRHPLRELGQKLATHGQILSGHQKKKNHMANGI